MELSQVELKVKVNQIAGVVCAIQGLAWTTMSLICIILYNYETITRSDIGITSYWDLVRISIYGMFFVGAMFPNQTPTGRVFTGLAWIHFLLNVLWTVMSLLILRTQTTRRRLTAWSYLTLTICALDFVTVLILGVDYNNSISRYFINNAALQEMVCANGILPVLVIAVKGFVLWIMNVCLGFTLLLTTRRLKKVGSPEA